MNRIKNHKKNTQTEINFAFNITAKLKKKYRENTFLKLQHWKIINKYLAREIMEGYK